MAGKNYFADLKNYGIKEIKFKQGVHIEAAHTNEIFGQVILSAPVYGKVNQGVCVALTMEWLKSQLSEVKFNPFSDPRDAGGKRFSAAKNLMHQITVTHAAQFQMAYNEGRKDKTRRECLTKIADEYGLKIADDKDDNLEGATELVLARGWHACSEGQGVYFSVGITKNDSEFRHAVGLTRKSDGYRFFDSNVGAYRITDKLNFMGWPAPLPTSVS